MTNTGGEASEGGGMTSRKKSPVYVASLLAMFLLGYVAHSVQQQQQQQQHQRLSAFTRESVKKIDGAPGGAEESAAGRGRFPPGCAWDCYLDAYPDLAKGLERTEAAALEHWIELGRGEGRRCGCGEGGAARESAPDRAARTPKAPRGTGDGDDSHRAKAPKVSRVRGDNDGSHSAGGGGGGSFDATDADDPEQRRRQRIVILAGPHKSASTTLQSFLNPFMELIMAHIASTHTSLVMVGQH